MSEIEVTNQASELPQEAPQESLKIYEIGYLLAPIIPEEKLPEEVAKIRAILDKNSAVTISEEFPKLRALAYTISKSKEGKRQHFSNAYFGWIKFELKPENYSEVKGEMDSITNIIRYLIIKSVRENTMAYTKVISQKRVEGEKPKKIPTETTGEAKKEVNQAEIDKSIDELITEIE